MTKRSNELVIPLSGLYFLLKDLRDAQKDPLTFPLDWKKDQLQVFFTKLVEEKIGVWKNEPTIIMGDTSTISNLSNGDQLG